MAFFNKKIKTEKIAKSLSGFFDVSYGSLVSRMKSSTAGKNLQISRDMDRELLYVPMVGIIAAIRAVFLDSFLAEDIMVKFQEMVIKNYVVDDLVEKLPFAIEFNERWKEYGSILMDGNDDALTQFGQIFCNHFYGSGGNGFNLEVETLVGNSFMVLMVEVKKFLDGLLERSEIIL